MRAALLLELDDDVARLGGPWMYASQYDVCALAGYRHPASRRTPPRVGVGSWPSGNSHDSETCRSGVVEMVPIYMFGKGCDRPRAQQRCTVFERGQRRRWR